MARKLGCGKTPGSGRKKGTPNKKSLKLFDALDAKKLNLIDEFYKIYKESDLEGKRLMILKSMDFIFPKLKSIEIEHSGNQEKPIQVTAISLEERIKQIAESDET